MAGEEMALENNQSRNFLVPLAELGLHNPHPTLQGVAVALLVITGSLLLWRGQRSKYVNLPPGPRALPLVGSLHLLGSHPHRKLAELASQYGPLMSVWLGQRLCVVASSPEAAKEFLKLQDANFAFRPPLRAMDVILPGDIAFHEITPANRHMRKILVTELMSTKQLQSSQYIRMEEMASTLYRIANENGPICLSTHVSFMATNVVSRMIFSRQLEGAKEQDNDTKMLKEFIELVEEVKICISAIYIGDFFNVPKCFDLQGLNKRFQKLQTSMDKFYKKMIEEYKDDKRRNPSKEGKKTLLDIFLEQLEFPETGVTKEHIEGVIYDMLLAGTETTALTVEWAMAELLHNPSLLKKATLELDNVVGFDRTVQESDLPHLKYLHAIVKETLRLHPPIPLLVPHQCKTATKAFGYDIPAHTRVFVNLWAIGHNNNNWKKPLEFVPERFFVGGENVATEFMGQHFDFLPFGSGRRQCPGMGLASIEVNLQLASLMHAFEWKAQNLDLEEGRLETSLRMGKPLVAMAKPRLSLHLYK